MKVKVWNDNTFVYREDFRGRKVEIPPGGFIEMEADEAHIFKGTFSTIVRDADGQPVKEFFKMIRVEKAVAAAPEAKVDPLLCQVCRYLAKDKTDFGAHMSSHMADHVVDEEAEAEIVRKRGRPKKEAQPA